MQDGAGAEQAERDRQRSQATGPGFRSVGRWAGSHPKGAHAGTDGTAWNKPKRSAAEPAGVVLLYAPLPPHAPELSAVGCPSCTTVPNKCFAPGYVPLWRAVSSVTPDRLRPPTGPAARKSS